MINPHQVALWKCAADVQRVISFYQGELDHRAYADGRGGYGQPWPEDRVGEFIQNRLTILEELQEILAEK